MGFKEGLFIFESITMETKMQFVDIILFFDQYSSPSPPLIQKYIVGSLVERFSSGTCFGYAYFRHYAYLFWKLLYITLSD